MKNNKNSTKNVDQNSLDFFGVGSETELKEEINKNWNVAKCPHCSGRIDLLRVKSYNDSIVCPHCGHLS